MTKLSGFLISCAMPAVSWPSEASFSVWTRRSCAVRRSSSDASVLACAPPRFRTGGRSRWRSPPGRQRSETSSICLSVNGRTSVRVKASTPIGDAFAHHRHAEDCAEAAQPLPLDEGVVGVRHHVGEYGSTLPSSSARPVTEPRSGSTGIVLTYVHEFRRKPVGSRRERTVPCLCRVIVALSASQSRAADSTSVCSTVFRSNVERLITFSTSAVAVCCRRIRQDRRCVPELRRTAAYSQWRSQPGLRRFSGDLLVLAAPARLQPNRPR